MLKLLQIIDASSQKPAGSVQTPFCHKYSCTKKEEKKKRLVKVQLKKLIFPKRKKKHLIKMSSTTISNLFIMQKQKEALGAQTKGSFSAVMALAFVGDSAYCNVSHKIKYS